MYQDSPQVCIHAVRFVQVLHYETAFVVFSSAASLFGAKYQ